MAIATKQLANAETQGTAVAREYPVNAFPWQPKHVTTQTDMHATIQQLLEAVFSIGSVYILSCV
jgi:hypothetical protein